MMKGILNFQRRGRRSNFKPPRSLEEAANNPNRSFNIIDPYAHTTPDSPNSERPYIDPLTSLCLRNSCSLLVQNVKCGRGSQNETNSVNNTLSSSIESRQPQRHYHSTPPISTTYPKNMSSISSMATENANTAHINRLSTLAEEPTIYREERNDSGVTMSVGSNAHEQKDTQYRPATASALNPTSPVNWEHFSLSRSKNANNIDPWNKSTSSTEVSAITALGHRLGAEQATGPSHANPDEPLTNFRDSLEQQFAIDTSIPFNFNSDDCSPHDETWFTHHSISSFTNPYEAQNRARQSRLSLFTLFGEPTEDTHSAVPNKRQNLSFAKRFSAHFSWKRYSRG
ncbi:hypothetical protein CPC735_026440 [Coccidioides posadasii C735 delta SOWgp]|uniref:Uncharacterized protein n=1 Tax=Coccidioides posadasii (strain C735) TaxID=222929 RepID=C5P7A8_COCP7|nr:hypothetical protein CPC735_026440 [Coccidioides posadasii C735 delta SOWgp]EER27308.1 hypothetical protein CPC735_026440 [Coccidioides posadasii C735 delta SOWgp]|eukprot:XP_003069453.1 hypothetical protein CPC735_026440 [Coccidioides posadasii C735 delta SOWgp]